MEAIHKVVFSNFDQEYFNELVKRLNISKEKSFKDLSKRTKYESSNRTCSEPQCQINNYG